MSGGGDAHAVGWNGACAQREGWLVATLEGTAAGMRRGLRFRGSVREFRLWLAVLRTGPGLRAWLALARARN